MTSCKPKIILHFFHHPVLPTIFAIFFVHGSFALNPDGISLLSFKYNILSDPLSVLETWNYSDLTPCSWRGVTCASAAGKPEDSRVVHLALPDSQLTGSVPPDLGMIQHLRFLDLSNNFLNGSLPEALFNASQLQAVSFAKNQLSGEVPAAAGVLRSLSYLNLSGNFFSGGVPGGFGSAKVLDLSFNLFDWSLPADFGGGSLGLMNLSHNNLSGTISPESVRRIPENATVDLSFNNLTGEIPKAGALWNQKKELFAGNVDLCGRPLKILCSFPSSKPASSSSPAIAVQPNGSSSPETPKTGGSAAQAQQQGKNNRMTPGTIAGITVGDIAGIGVLAIIVLSVYQIRKRRSNDSIEKDKPTSEKGPSLQCPDFSRSFSSACPCLVRMGGEEEEEEAAAAEGTCSDGESDGTAEGREGGEVGRLVMVDGGEMALDMETLLRAAAYVVGAAGRSIVYRAVLLDGRALAVRRMSGGGGCGWWREFESQTRAIAKLRHPNLVRVRGFYWGSEEKLLICDYVPNGSLAAAATYRRHGSSPYHQPLEVRLKIARGVARGLAYIHEKKQVHGNLKPSNILLTDEMEPIISDLGLDRLEMGSSKPKLSSRSFNSQQDLSQDLSMGQSPFSASANSVVATCPYHAPESLKNVKPSSKWDVYAYGILLLKLLTGKEFREPELRQWASGPAEDERNRASVLADVAIRAEVAAREDAVLACFRLGFCCASLVPQKRPSMKEALQVIERVR